MGRFAVDNGEAAAGRSAGTKEQFEAGKVANLNVVDVLCIDNIADADALSLFGLRGCLYADTHILCAESAELKMRKCVNEKMSK